jgi:hypothetical protein
LTSGLTSDIVIENLVYGAFPHQRMGQQVVGKSAGITDEIEREMVEFCNTWGDCRNLKFRRSLNQFPLNSRLRDGRKAIAVVKVTNAGKDSMGREGTLVRHALVLAETDYRYLEFNPFVLESQGIFLTVWTRLCDCETIYLKHELIPPADLSEVPRSFYGPLKLYAATVMSGGEIYMYLNNHIQTAEDMIYYLIKILPLEIRAGLALTTFAFKKNIDFKIGCYYRQLSQPADPLRVQFETTGQPGRNINDYLQTLFDYLNDEKYGRAAKMLTEPMPRF